jgi:hypothetical protein
MIPNIQINTGTTKPRQQQRTSNVPTTGVVVTVETGGHHSHMNPYDTSLFSRNNTPSSTTMTAVSSPAASRTELAAYSTNISAAHTVQHSNNESNHYNNMLFGACGVSTNEITALSKNGGTLRNPNEKQSRAMTAINNKEIVIRKHRKQITVEDIAQCFEMPIRDASQVLGISLTQLKRLCREFNISRWPYRRLNSIQRRIDVLVIMLKRCEENGDMNGYKQTLEEKEKLEDEVKAIKNEASVLCSLPLVAKLSESLNESEEDEMISAPKATTSSSSPCKDNNNQLPNVTSASIPVKIISQSTTSGRNKLIINQNNRYLPYPGTSNNAMNLLSYSSNSPIEHSEESEKKYQHHIAMNSYSQISEGSYNAGSYGTASAENITTDADVLSRRESSNNKRIVLKMERSPDTAHLMNRRNAQDHTDQLYAHQYDSNMNRNHLADPSTSMPSSVQHYENIQLLLGNNPNSHIMKAFNNPEQSQRSNTNENFNSEQTSVDWSYNGNNNHYTTDPSSNFSRSNQTEWIFSDYSYAASNNKNGNNKFYSHSRSKNK